MRFFIFLITPSIFCLLAYGDPFEESYKLVKLGAKEELGRLLFFDKILSGNKNISCATCHNPLTFTGDALSLPVGEGGEGLGTSRNTGNTINKIIRRIPRNSPPLFNLGDKSIITLFLDGRIEHNEEFPSGIKTPLGMDLPERLDGLLAAQVFFPVINIDEMTGHQGENPVADLVMERKFSQAFSMLAKRLQNNAEYVELFKKAFPETVKSEKDIRFYLVANAIASFEANVFSTLKSPYDKFIKGDQNAISNSAKRGRLIFNGKGKCVNCHNGNLQTDQRFHAIAIPQIGPGKNHGEKEFEDFGREAISKDINDRFKFKTPSLRNVALTGPWGHDGAYGNLKDIILHHLNPESMLKSYTLEKAYLPLREDVDRIDGEAMKDQEMVNAILLANELPKISLTNPEIEDLLNFLYTLTDPIVFEFSRLIPKRVPSDLPLAD